MTGAMPASSPTLSASGIVAPNVRDLDVLRGELAEWLASRILGSSEIVISALRYPSGAGLSHETILFSAHRSSACASDAMDLVVRIKPSGHHVYQDDMFEQQFRIMQVMADSGEVRVAKPLWFEPDGTLLGAPFFVMEQMAGRVAVSFPPYAGEGWLFTASPDERKILWDDSVRQLASIQRVPVTAAPFIDGLERKGFDHELHRWERYKEWMLSGRDLPLVRAAWEVLIGNLPNNRAEGIVWGDARLGNMMIGDDFRVRGVMDWEQISLGGALHDLAWWLHSERMQTQLRNLPSLEGMGNRDATVSLWQEVCGKSVDDLEWYELFAAFKMLCLSYHMLDLKGQKPTHADYLALGSYRGLADLLRYFP